MWRKKNFLEETKSLIEYKLYLCLYINTNVHHLKMNILETG
jgi:hypothetical protein